jgi:hypothetical protein
MVVVWPATEVSQGEKIIKDQDSSSQEFSIFYFGGEM